MVEVEDALGRFLNQMPTRFRTAEDDVWINAVIIVVGENGLQPLRVAQQIQPDHGQTPLMLACKAGAPACVRLLLGAGADATLFDSLQERNALHYAGAAVLRS